MEFKDKLLVVVDYQNDFVDGALGFGGAEELDTGISAKVKEYLDNGHSVLFTMDTHYEDYLSTNEGKHLPIKHCISGTPGHLIYGQTRKIAESYIWGNVPKTDELLNLGNIHSYPTIGLTDSTGTLTIDKLSLLRKGEIGDVEALNAYLSDKFYEGDGLEVEFCGIVSYMCVISNAIITKACLPKADIIINASLCAGPDKELHNNSIEIMRNLHMAIID